MKILVLANSDLASCYALNLLLPRLVGHDVHLTLSSMVGDGKPRPPELEQLKFFEQSLFNDIVFPLIDRCATSPMKSFSGLSSLLSTTPTIENAINTTESIARLRSMSPDLIVSIRYGGILRSEVISIPTHGVLNLHSGRLPEYRGVMASFWAMLSGDQELGTTLHFIADASIDTGKIVSRTATAVVPGKSYLWQVINLYKDGVDTAVDAIATLSAGKTIAGVDQAPGGNYFSFPGQDELDRFRHAGHLLYDSSEIVDLIQTHFIPPST